RRAEDHRLHADEREEQALDPVDQHREPEHGGERRAEAEAQLRRGEGLLIEEPAVQRKRHEDRRALARPELARRDVGRAPAPARPPEVPREPHVRGGRDEVHYNVGHVFSLAPPMLDTLTARLAKVVKQLRGEARLTESNIQDALREVRIALLEADVALPVVKHFIESVRAKALGAEVLSSLTPGQALVGVVHRELAHLMGDASVGLELAAQPPAVILMAGLQGSGKTTTSGKLARLLVAGKKKVLLVSCDVYRPAAIEQLKAVAAQAGADFFASSAQENPLEIARKALEHARTRYYDVLIVDTAGRLAVDEDMMREIAGLHAALNPVETLFIVDSMQGQDAVNVARAFSERLPLTGVILTKLDGDARGGAALSVRHVTGKPIKFA